MTEAGRVAAIYERGIREWREGRLEETAAEALKRHRNAKPVIEPQPVLTVEEWLPRAMISIKRKSSRGYDEFTDTTSRERRLAEADDQEPLIPTDNPLARRGRKGSV